MLNKYKKGIIVTVGLILIFVVYTIYFKPEGEQDSLIKSTMSSNQQSSAQVLGAEINRAIREIDSLDLDKSIFEHPVLVKLVDRSKEIPAEPYGRVNPFEKFELGSNPMRNDQDNDNDAVDAEVETETESSE